MALIACPECAKQISDRAASCPNCGLTSPGKILKCPDCDAQIEPHYQICKNCGCPLLTKFPKATPTPVSAPQIGWHMQSAEVPENRQALTFEEKLTAIILTLLCGGLGLHRFYLRDKSGGLVILAIALLATLVEFYTDNSEIKSILFAFSILFQIVVAIVDTILILTGRLAKRV